MIECVSVCLGEMLCSRPRRSRGTVTVTGRTIGEQVDYKRVTWDELEKMYVWVEEFQLGNCYNICVRYEQEIADF